MIVVGKKSKPGKPQHLKVGQEYEVGEEMGNILIKNGQAELKGAKAPTQKSDPKKKGNATKKS